MRLKESLLLLTILLRVSLQRDNYEIIKLLNDLILKFNVPTKVSAYICWPKDDQLLFWKNLSFNKIPCKIAKTSEKLTYSFPKEHQLYLLDASCNGYYQILEQGKQLQLFNQPYRWIIWGQTNQNILKEFYFNLGSKVFIIDKRENGANKGNYNIKALYKLTDNSSEFLENHLAEWNFKEGVLMYQQLSIARNRTNLMRTNINISYVVTNPDTHNHFEDYRNPHIDTISKVDWFVMKTVISFLNATSTPLYQPSWGYRDGNSTQYSGMIGDLQADMAEIGGTGLFVTLDRLDVIEYVTPSSATYIKFIFKAPPISYVSNVFTLPFDTYVWYGCFGLIPLIFTVVYLIVKWEWRDPAFENNIKTNHINAITPLRPGFFDVMLMELGAITQQGTDTEPQSFAGRIATLFAFLTCMFLYTAYSANIVAILQSTTESIKTLEDLLNSRISVGVEDIVYSHYYFKTAEEPIRKAIYQQKVAPKGQKPNFMTVDEGISKVREGFFAFHVELSRGYQMIAETFQESEKCSLKEMEFVHLTQPWVSIKKRTPYKEIIKVGLRKNFENGLHRREFNRIYTKKPVCHSKGSNFGSAGILDCYAAFLIYGIEIIISFILLSFEHLLNKHLHRVI